MMTPYDSLCFLLQVNILMRIHILHSRIIVLFTTVMLIYIERKRRRALTSGERVRPQGDFFMGLKNSAGVQRKDRNVQLNTLYVL